MSIDSVFDGDHESAIIFMKICTWRMKIVKYDIICTLGCREGRNGFVTPCRVRANLDVFFVF